MMARKYLSQTTTGQQQLFLRYRDINNNILSLNYYAFEIVFFFCLFFHAALLLMQPFFMPLSSTPTQQSLSPSKCTSPYQVLIIYLGSPL